MYKGRVDNWRIEREIAYFNYAMWTETPVSKYSYFPLPFDDEINTEDQDMDREAKIIELYQSAKDSGYLDEIIKDGR